MKHYETDYLQSVTDSLENEIGVIINKSNSAATNIYNNVQAIGKDIEEVKKKVTILGDMITDLHVLTGKTKNSLYLTELPVVSNTNIDIEESVLRLAQNKETDILIDYKTVFITSPKPYQVLDYRGYPQSLRDALSVEEISHIQVDQIGYRFTVHIPLTQRVQLNSLRFMLPPEVNQYPLIENVKYSSDVGKTFKITHIIESDDTILDLNTIRYKNNIVDVHIQPVLTNYITFDIVSTDLNAFSFKQLKLLYKDFATSGEVIFGPLQSEEPILKVGLTSVKDSPNVTLEVSTNNEEWIPIQDSNNIDALETRKVVAFNTVNSSSFTTTDSVYKLYVRVKIKSTDYSNVGTNESLYREDTVLTGTPTDPNKFSAYRRDNSYVRYGVEDYYNDLVLNPSNINYISHVTEGVTNKIRGFTNTSISYSHTDNMNNVLINMKPLRLPPNVTLSAETFDPVYSKLYDLDVISYKGSLNTSERSDVCFKLVRPEDTYTIFTTESNQILRFTLNQNFIRSSSELMFQVPKENLIIKNSLGDVVIKIYSDTLYKARTENEEDIYIVNLTNYFCEVTSVVGQKYNNLYPFQILEADEFSLLNGYLVSGGTMILDVDGYTIKTTEVPYTVYIDYVNGNKIVRNETLYSYNHKMITNNLIERTVFKLDHRSVEKGSIELNKNTLIQNNKEENTFIILNPDKELLLVEEDTYLKE